MSFITVDDANSILGSDFAPGSDKARLVQLANVWMKKRIGFVSKSLCVGSNSNFG